LDIKRQLRIAVSTGEVSIGYSQTLKTMKTGRAKLVVISNKGAPGRAEEIKAIAKPLQVPIYVFDGDGRQLGVAASKPFPISALTIKKPGESEILDIVEE